MAAGLCLGESKKTPNLWATARATLVPGWGCPLGGDRVNEEEPPDFLEESSVRPGVSLFQTGRLPDTSCLRVIQVSPSHAPDTVGNLCFASLTP